FQRVAVLIDGPYARKRRIKLPYDRVCASVQDRIQAAVASEGDADIRAKCRLPRFLGVERFCSLAFADIAQNGQPSNNFARIVEQRREMTLNEYLLLCSRDDIQPIAGNDGFPGEGIPVEFISARVVQERKDIEGTLTKRLQPVQTQDTFHGWIPDGI